jgi:hypothetical protein
MPFLLPPTGMPALPTVGPWAMWVALVLSAIALACCAVLFAKLRRRSSQPPGGNAIADVLGAVLKRSHVPESDGVRWDVSIYPETLSVPGYVVLTAIVQNAYDLPRTVTLEIARDPLLPEGLRSSVALNPGEAGLLRIPLFVSRNLAPGLYEVRAGLSGVAPRGEGNRLLDRPSRRHRGPRKAALRIVSVHDHPPVNLFVYSWKGFTSLYNPPQTAPDISEVRILQELPSGPVFDERD